MRSDFPDQDGIYQLLEVEPGQAPQPALSPWRDYALAVVSNGWSPVPLVPGTKRPRYQNWDYACAGKPDSSWIAGHAKRSPNNSVGIACGILRDKNRESLGRLFVIDIDADDRSEAKKIKNLAFCHLGETRFVRSRSSSPRCALLYRLVGRVKSEKLTGAEILGDGHQFVAFGLHPSGVPYVWTSATPATTSAAEVPLVSRTDLNAFRKARGARDVDANPSARKGSRLPFNASTSVREIILSGGVGHLKWTVDAGLVVDGREKFLSWCVAKAGGDARCAFALFSSNADLVRPKGADPYSHWSIEDAETKAAHWRRSMDRRKAGARPPGRPRAAHRDPMSAEQQQAHKAAVERAYQKGEIGPSAIAVSARMLEFATGSFGVCTASLGTLESEIGRSRSTIAAARKELCLAGFWVHERSGVYAPILSNQFRSGQLTETVLKTISSVQTGVGPKSPVLDTPPEPIPSPPYRDSYDVSTLRSLLSTESWQKDLTTALMALKNEMTKSARMWEPIRSLLVDVKRPLIDRYRVNGGRFQTKVD